MIPTVSPMPVFRKGTSPWPQTLGMLGLMILVLAGSPRVHGQQRASRGADETAPIPVSEFSRMVREFSEPGGYFQAHNLTSNETSYLHVVDKLKELGISGGAYIGVGPEQNFTYIAKIRPSIAFIVDIRRQAILQHLLYKAIFHAAHDRAEFLSLLFSKPLSKTRAETKGSFVELLNYIFEAATTEREFSANLANVRKVIADDFQVPLSPEDVQSLTSVYRAFWRANLGIAYGYGFPTLGDLLMETDLRGKAGNFLANEQDYQFVRELQLQNRVIPVVGDFAGRKALAAVADYLRKNDYATSAFYTSNVEEYLYGNEVFDAFAANVRKLPISDRSVFIRSVKAYLGPHPAWVSGNRMITLLERLSVFLADHKAGLYPDYWSLVTTHYISGTRSLKRAPPSPGSR